MMAHLVRDDPEGGHLGLGEPGGEGRGHRPGSRQVPAPLDAGLAVRRPLRPLSRGPWCVLASRGWVRPGLRPPRMDGLRGGLGSAVVKHACCVGPPYLAGEMVKLGRSRRRYDAR
jgi:hypothetical protein